MNQEKKLQLLSNLSNMTIFTSIICFCILAILTIIAAVKQKNPFSSYFFVSYLGGLISLIMNRIFNFVHLQEIENYQEQKIAKF